MDKNLVVGKIEQLNNASEEGSMNNIIKALFRRRSDKLMNELEVYMDLRDEEDRERVMLILDKWLD